MAFLDFLQLIPSGSIGGIAIEATLEEIHVDALHITRHPVEVGAPITDHAYSRPKEVTIKAAWSNSGIDAALGMVSALFSGTLSGMDYASGVYSQLIALQESKQLFDIVTTKRQYSNMQLVALQSKVDEKTSSILNVIATCREIPIVYTQSTTLPAQSNQANPEQTASATSTGTKNAVSSTPSPGGSLPVQ